MALRLNGSTSGYVGIDAPATAASNTLVLPNGNGSNGQALTTNGSGTLSWTSITGSQWTTSGSDIYYTTGKVLVGSSSAVGSELFQVVGGDSARERIHRNINDQYQPVLFLSKARGTSNELVSNSDTLGSVYFQGADGTSLKLAASVEAQVDGAPGTNDMPGRLVFSTTADGASSPTERMRITNNGFFKASSTGSYRGSASQYHELRSARNDEFVLMLTHDGTSGNQYGLSVETTNDQNNSGIWFLQCKGSTTLRAEIRTNGGIANYSANNVNLSDINTKKNITPAVNTWNCIKEWEIVNFHYKDQPDDADLNLGVIAQQVAESCPEVITVFSEAKEAKPAVLDNDGNEVEAAQEAQPEKLGIKEQQMYWMAIKALQEAMERIETLEAANASLEARLTALEVTP